MISALSTDTYEFRRGNREVQTGNTDVVSTLRTGHESQSNVKSLKTNHNNSSQHQVSDALINNDRFTCLSKKPLPSGSAKSQI